MTDQPMMRSELLNEVDKLIHGERQSQYGSWDQNFQDIADLWNMHLRRKLSTPIDPYDVAMLMVGMKYAREANQHKHDNLADLGGYTAIADALVHTIITPTVEPTTVPSAKPTTRSRRRTR